MYGGRGETEKLYNDARHHRSMMARLRRRGAMAANVISAILHIHAALTALGVALASKSSCEIIMASRPIVCTRPASRDHLREAYRKNTGIFRREGVVPAESAEPLTGQTRINAAHHQYVSQWRCMGEGNGE